MYIFHLVTLSFCASATGGRDGNADVASDLSRTQMPREVTCGSVAALLEGA
jgi:hypothetical protein